ncbi:MAG: flagellar assembly protein FliW [Opitutaceae bacterium]|nr:flagellar assembly protein FliW [Opitutaceae bacterium]
MKIQPEMYPTDLESPAANGFLLPHGLIGFARHTQAALHYQPDHLPFLWLKLHGAEPPVHFVVIEPGGIIPGYEPELFADDAFALDLANPADAMVLNIVTLRHQNPLEATVNLIGPIIVNRRLRVGRQIVISNYSRYSAHHALVESPLAPVARAYSA